MKKFKYNWKQLVEHIKSTDIYRIEYCSSDNELLEESGEQFYVYEHVMTGNRWVRKKSEMEDGRFKLLG